MRTVEVVRTYLEIPDRRSFRPCFGRVEGLRLERVKSPAPSFYRFLYTSVGKANYWTDRIMWTDEQIRSHFRQEQIHFCAIFVENNPAGYFELVQLDDGGWEVNYLGIMPDFQGSGLGKHVLSTAVQMCFNQGARRVQLDTCTLDHPAAKHLYENTGFVPYKTERYLRSLPEREDQSEWIKAASCQEIMLAAV